MDERFALRAAVILIASNKMQMTMCFAGLDGSGKTTQAQLTSAWLSRNQLANEFIRFHTEPTKAEAIEIVGKARAYLIEQRLMLPMADMAFLKEAFHIEMKLHRQIQPTRAAGKSIVFDRYLETFDAFCAVMRRPKNWVRAINPALPTPDLSFFLDVLPEVCFARIQQTARRLGDHETIEFLQRARDYYLSHQHEYQFIVLDGTAPVEQLQREIQEIVLQHMATAS